MVEKEKILNLIKDLSEENDFVDSVYKLSIAETKMDFWELRLSDEEAEAWLLESDRFFTLIYYVLLVLINKTNRSE